MEPTATGGDDLRTRDRVARAVLEHGPVTASELACQVGITSAAVRRHLDALVDAGLAAVREPVRDASRGRGRPARAYVLTSAGHDSMSGPMYAAYDDLAASAMAFLAEQLGPEAIEAFAERRVADLERRYAPVVEAAGDDVAARTRALAGALAGDGYAASTRSLKVPASAGAAPGSTRDVGTQLCQGHCPVQHVAARFPQLCEAETEVFSRLLGVHVQRLATLAGGAHVCTTHVPTTGHTPTTGAPAAGATSTSRSTSPTPTTSTTRTSDGRTR
ncbi:MAG TPA: helix-turn-helix domain-containing protein [Actinomycetales bacterium]